MWRPGATPSGRHESGDILIQIDAPFSSCLPRCKGIVAEAFAAEQPELQTLPEHRFDAVLKLERHVSHDGSVAIGGNYYSVPDRTRWVVEVQQLPDLIRILDLGTVVAEHGP